MSFKLQLCYCSFWDNDRHLSNGFRVVIQMFAWKIEILVSYKNISGNKLRRNVQKNVALKTQTLSVVLKQLALFGFEGQRPFRVDNFNR